nr:aldose epimerase family protein [Mangrovicoccus sp. HB161399]
MTASFLTWGATLQDLRIEGVTFPLVLGSDRFDPYLGSLLYSGALVGRFANRIAGGRFSIDGQSFQADRNFLRRHTLHGGSGGTGEMLWSLQDHAADRVSFALELPDKHMGFPGDLAVQAEFSLPGDGVLAMEVVAQCNRSTPCNFAQHSYFNLDDAAGIAGHHLQILGDSYLPVDEEMIPTGEIAPVEGTRFDFRRSRAIGNTGYDHNFCTARDRMPIRPVAVLSSPASGISLTVESTEPGLQFYDGALLDVRDGLNGRSYGTKSGVALEAQAWPDAPNMAAAPNAILRPSETYSQSLRYVFRQE